MTKKVPFLLFLLWSTYTFAQTSPDTLVTARIDSLLKPKPDTTWRRSMSTGLNLNQASFSDNWKAGGVSSIAVNAYFNAKANWKRGHKTWDNEMQLQYGLVKNKGQNMRKSLDRLYLDTKYGHRISSDWNTYVSANFLSQFTRGYQYDIDTEGNDRLISNILSPGFLTVAIGAEYKPVPYFFVRLSPFAPRFTFLVDDKVALNERYGVPEGDIVRTEWGSAMAQASFEKDVMTNVNLKLNYMIFYSYEQPSLKRTDHRLNAVFTAKVNKYINVNLMGNLVYDYDQDHAVQYSQSLGLGILFTRNGLSVKNRRR